jgi:hypothetical protein
VGELLPMDRVRLPDGTDATVNSAAYWDGERQKFTICGSGEWPGPMYYADECALLHRCEFKPYSAPSLYVPLRRCACGAVRTTMADEMLPRGNVTWN